MEYMTSMERMGLEKGLEQGGIVIFKTLMEQRFGAIDERYLAQINAADFEHLNRWSLKLLQAESVVEVFK